MADGRVRVEADEPLRRRRLPVLFRVVLVVPHYIVVSIWSLVIVPAVAVAWFALLIEGRLPSFLERFLGAFLRYEGQVTAWFALLSTRYPDPLHTEEHPFRIELPDRPRQPRLITLFRLPLALPAVVLTSAFNVVLSVAAAAAWFAALALGRTTAGLQELGTFCLRYQLETQAYATLLTSTYPRLAPPDVTTAPE
ncbi:MAG: hypothetical protein QOE91_1312 [Gaiellaceae bacterium]|nr:hypothetical protein [Gaiellaceae bacterium]